MSDKGKVGVVCLGRGVGVDPLVGKDVPTDYFEMVTPQRGHSGVINRNAIDLRDPLCFIGGGCFNAWATKELVCTLASVGNVAFLTFAAGRPKYLAENENVPKDFTEGSVMWRWIQEHKGGCPGELGKDVFIQLGNRTSMDDIEQSFAMALEHGVKRLRFVTVAVHMPRILTYCQHVKLTNLDYHDIEVGYEVSEHVLVQARHISQDQWQMMRSSLPFVRSMDWEMNGLIDFATNQYQSVQDKAAM